MRVLALVLALAVALSTLAPDAAAKRSPLEEARSGLDSLATLRDGGGAFDPAIAPLLVEAAVALGTDPAFWPDAAHPVLASLRPAGNGTLLAQVRALHARARAGHGTPADVAALEASFRDGQFGDPVLLNDDMWALRAAHALGTGAIRLAAYAQAAAHRLASEQDPGGGWSWRLGGPASVDVTGMAAVALLEAKALEDGNTTAARAYLAARQNATSGGYAEEGGAANCDSTVWAIRGLAALAAPVPPAAWGYLASLHQPDGGFAYQAGQPSNALCTAEVATLLGDWGAAHGDLVGYAGTQSAPGLGLTAVAAALSLALLARRAPWARSPPRTAQRSPPPAAR